jgi:hypothetical protein
MHPEYQTRNFDLIEVTPPSSPALKEEINSILVGSQNWTAAVESLNRDDGSYRIILQGQLQAPDRIAESL